MVTVLNSMSKPIAPCVCVCACFVAYEETNFYNDMGMTYVLQGERDL